MNGQLRLCFLMMKPVSELPKTKFRFVFTDIDDTLTEDGRLTADAFSALWRLSENGVHVVPVTGRPAGWCELIARQWPVAGIVGENGGFYFRLVGNEMKRHFEQDLATRQDNKLRLERIRAEILSSVPGSKIASDQFCRMMDLAVDFCEDVVPPLPMYEVERIVEIFNKYGAQAKISSIHVNGWFGEHNKLSTCRAFLQSEFNLDMKAVANEILFVGDSPNDEPMFEAFPVSVAVANIKKFQDKMKHLPKYVTTQEGGHGFAELVNQLFSS